MIYWDLWRYRPAHWPAHWPGKWASISLIIEGGKKKATESKGERRGTKVFWGLLKIKKRKRQWARGGWLKELHPEALEGAATDQVSISQVSLPVGISRSSVARRGGQRGHRACQTDTGGYAPGKRTHTQHTRATHACTPFPVLTSGICV